MPCVLGALRHGDVKDKRDIDAVRNDELHLVLAHTTALTEATLVYAEGPEPARGRP